MSTPPKPIRNLTAKGFTTKPEGAVGIVQGPVGIFFWPENIVQNYNSLKKGGFDVQWIIPNTRYRIMKAKADFPWVWTGTGRSKGKWMLIKGRKV